MTRQRLFLATVIAVLAAPAAQTQGDVIAAAIKSDGGVVVPPAAHTDPASRRASRPSSQLPDEGPLAGWMRLVDDSPSRTD